LLTAGSLDDFLATTDLLKVPAPSVQALDYFAALFSFADRDLVPARQHNPCRPPGWLSARASSLLASKADQAPLRNTLCSYLI